MRNALDVTRRERLPLWNMNDFDEMFERAFRNPFSLLEDMRPRWAEEWFQPDYDLDETDEAYLLSVDLPGVRKEDLKVDLTENVLSISGERHQEHGSRTKGRYERSYGRFQQSFTLPSTVDVQNVEANLEDGVLRIALPKTQSAQRRSIPIGTGRGGFFSKLIGAMKKEDKESRGEEAGATH